MRRGRLLFMLYNCFRSWKGSQKREHTRSQRRYKFAFGNLDAVTKRRQTQLIESPLSLRRSAYHKRWLRYILVQPASSVKLINMQA